MAQMIVRNLDDAVAERFKAKARAAGKSTEQLLRELVESAVQPDIGEILRDLDAICETTKGRTIVDPVESIRQDRDSGYGRL
ncbi:MAG: ribbon-helix-helix protein, CopG family [Hyphomicrobiaceae bacterium]|nr:ribbon-helix-helix protein, CopG family [Hyphomicrobiaceae bacterium]